jgi:UDP-GlcNAc:undecaprenyl-phosphate GlcNAc-1-phosphate transferase
VEALLLRFLTTFGAALIVVPLVRAFARSLGVVAQGEDGITSRPVVALFGGAALGVIVFGQAVVLGAHAELAVVLGAGAVVLFVGVIDEVVGLQPLTRLGVLLAVALACLFFRCRLGWTTSLTVDSMLTVVWVVGITRTYDRLDARDGLCAGVAIIVLVGLLCVAAFVDPAVVGAGASHYVMVLVGALSAFLVFNSSPASIYLGSGGSLFVGMNIAVLTLVPGSSLTGEVATGGPRPSTIIAILAPLAVLFVPLIDTSLETVLRVRAGRASAADGGRSLAARLLALRWSERTAVAVLWILAAAVTLLGIALSPGAWRLTRGAYLGGAALLTLGVALTRVGAVPTGRVGHGRRRVAPLVVDPSYPFRATEVIFHLGLVLAAYYGAYRVRFPDPPDFANNFYYFVKSLPITLAVQMTALFAVGAYRSNRTALGIAGAGVFARGVFLGAIGIQLVLLYAYRFESYPRAAFVTYAVLLFLLLTGQPLDRAQRHVRRPIGPQACEGNPSGPAASGSRHHSPQHRRPRNPGREPVAAPAGLWVQDPAPVRHARPGRRGHALPADAGRRDGDGFDARTLSGPLARPEGQLARLPGTVRLPA